MRTFVAVDLDERLKTRFTDLINSLDTGHRSIRWVNRQRMHITLKFLGEISESQRYDIESVLKRVTEKHSSILLHFRGAGTFPLNSKNPRVLWVGLDKNEKLLSLQQDIEDELAGLGFPKENRLFRPHLTLGRVKKRSQIQTVVTRLNQYRNEFFGDSFVDKVLYYRSTLKPDGAEYTVLSEFGLT